MRLSLTHSLLALCLLVCPARAQQWIQVPICGNALPSSVNPSAATIAVNPSGQLCVLTGAISVTVPTPPAAAFPQPSSVVVTTVSGVVSGSYADGALTTAGSTGDGAYTNIASPGSIIAILKGIFTNVLTPVAVSGSFSVTSPLGVNIAATTPINVTVSSPLSVAIVSSPVNVTGSFSTVQTGQNIVQLANQTLASPTTYGIAPVGSTQGVNAFITNNVSVTPPTPLNVTVGNVVSPAGVAVVNSITLASSPLNTTLVTIPGSPIGVILTQSSVTVSNNVTVTPPTPLNVTINASPVSVSVGNTVTVTTPTPLQVTLPASPISVGIAGPTPLNVTLVAIPGSPQAMTLTQGQVYLSQQPASTVIGYSATPLSALASSPGTLVVSGPHQLARVYCALRAPATITTSVYLRLYDSTSTQLATGTQRGFLLIAANGAAPATGISAQITTVPPGEQYSNGIVAIIATTGMGTIFGTGTSQTTETVDCNIAYN